MRKVDVGQPLRSLALGHGAYEPSAPSATGGNLLLASATLEFTKGQQPLTHATEIGRIQTFGISCASNMQ